MGEEVMTKGIGASIVAFSAFSLSLLSDVDSYKAIAVSFIPMMISLLDNLFISKSVEKLGLDATPQYFWVVVQAGILGCEGSCAATVSRYDEYLLSLRCRVTVAGNFLT